MNIGNAISKVGNKLTGKLGKTSLILKAKSPEILIGAGIVLVLGGTYMACRATSKAKDVIEARDNEIAGIKNRELQQINEMKESAEKLGLTKLPEDKVREITKETRSDKFVAHVRCGWELTKLFAPAIAVEAAGIGCFLGAHGIMRKRNAALMAAYEATDKAYRRLKEQQMQTENTEDKNDDHPELKDAKINTTKDTRYAFVFDRTCLGVWVNSADQNLSTARVLQNIANKQFQTYGYYFLNDVRSAFNKDRNKKGQVIGWSKEMGDTHIDFGLPPFVEDKDIIIYPNCHNCILDDTNLAVF